MNYFNGLFTIKGKQVHGFICAKTKKRAMELAYEVNRISKSYFNNYWSDCGNAAMMETAKDNEGVWIEPITYSNKYIPFEER